MGTALFETEVDKKNEKTSLRMACHTLDILCPTFLMLSIKRLLYRSSHENDSPVKFESLSGEKKRKSSRDRDLPISANLQPANPFLTFCLHSFLGRHHLSSSVVTRLYLPYPTQPNLEGSLYAFTINRPYEVLIALPRLSLHLQHSFSPRLTSEHLLVPPFHPLMPSCKPSAPKPSTKSSHDSLRHLYESQYPFLLSLHTESHTESHTEKIPPTHTVQTPRISFTCVIDSCRRDFFQRGGLGTGLEGA